MRAKTNYFLRCAILIALAAGASSGTFAADERWLRASTPDKSFSVETPCTAEQLELGQMLPVVGIPGAGMTRDSRVVCLSKPMMLIARLMKVPASEAREVPLFDRLAKAVTSGNSAGGKPLLTMVGGHRALLSQVADGSKMEGTSLIEVSRESVVATNVDLIGEMPNRENATIIALHHRFATSVEIPGK